MPFLRRTTPIWGTQHLPGPFKEGKACLVQIGQTAHKLEKNAHAGSHVSYVSLADVRKAWECNH